MSDIQTIKEKIDIVDLIGEYIQVKPSGTYHKACCPFHNEKTPSFMIHRDRQRFHCFGCNQDGDIFTFIEHMEGMEFIEALKYLADRAGVQLTQKGSDTNKHQKNRIKDINAAAAHFFHQFFMQMPASKEAMAYILGRGLTTDTIEAWQIGFVPDQWDLLTKYLLKKGHAIDDLVVAGLTIKRDNADAESGRGYYDRFRGRIMFPIWDIHGYIVGFTGRVLVETEKSGGKYVNTPQTPVYDKSRVVFGLNKAKQTIKKEDSVVIVEGQMDVITCHQAGMLNVVASSGTALTEQQIALLKRFSSNIRMAFDADAAGQAAAKRGIDLALEAGMSVRVIRIPEGQGKDPDECILQNKDHWFTAVEQATDVMNWYIEKAFAGKDLTDPKQKQAIAEEVLPEVSRIPFAIEKDHWLNMVAGKLGVDIAVLREDVARIVKSETKKDRVVGQLSQSGSSHQKEIEETEVPRSQVFFVLEQFFSLILAKNIENAVELLTVLDPVIANHPLYKFIKIGYTAGHNRDVIRASLVQKDQEVFDRLLMQAELSFSNMSDREAEKEAAAYVDQIIRIWKREKRTALLAQIEIAKKTGNEEEEQSILVQVQQLQ
ncbi:DNA primase [Patescibacteria group bacterium]|nr:DNA primase [Patescibacteria group bacterium]MBU1721784.1 DNA primase [Patescibacteria group bacterium]MBU1901377.1 DNA primase [Patescibacteria group bacterium]